MRVGYASGASEADEFILIEMEQALMHAFDATQDQQLLACLKKLIKYHSARHYLATLPVMERYIYLSCVPHWAALLHCDTIMNGDHV